VDEKNPYIEKLMYGEFFIAFFLLLVVEKCNQKFIITIYSMRCGLFDNEKSEQHKKSLGKMNKNQI
jgi:hypothetical protein